MVPGLWYPAGAGGMWLNYVVWCDTNKDIIPGNHHYFEYPYLKELHPDYSPFFNFSNHKTPPHMATVVLGSDRALFNFFLNILSKKKPSTDWIPTAGGFYQMKNVIKYNLDWCDIFENPKKFFDDVNSLTGYNIKLNQFTETAIEQYKNSCTWYSMTKQELYATDPVQECFNHCFDQCTNSATSLAQQTQQAWNLVESTLWTRKF